MSVVVPMGDLYAALPASELLTSQQMINSLGQPPCYVAAMLEGVCTGGEWDVSIQNNWHITPLTLIGSL
jgi:hypothetical protein